jgi:hypothetical protein
LITDASLCCRNHPETNLSRYISTRYDSGVNGGHEKDEAHTSGFGTNETHDSSRRISAH